MTADQPALRQQLAETLMRWHGRQLLCREHTQIISYGEAADAALAVVQPVLDARRLLYEGACTEAWTQRQRAEAAEAEIGKLRALHQQIGDLPK